MAKVEIIGRIPSVPWPLIDAIRDADPKLAKRFGKKCVENNQLKKEELNAIVGVACLAKAYELTLKIRKLLSEKTKPSTKLVSDAKDFETWGNILLQDNLPRLKR